MTVAVDREALWSEVAEPLQAEFRERYREVTRLPQASLELGPFLDAYLEQVVALFAATGGAIWFRAPEGDQLVLKALRGWEPRVWPAELQQRHDELLRFAMARPGSLLVKPFSRPARGVAAANPTDSFLVLGPWSHQGVTVAVIELLLGPVPARGQTAAHRHRYVAWLNHLLVFLGRGVEQRMRRAVSPRASTSGELDRLFERAADRREAWRRELEQELAAFAGWNFGSLADNQAFTVRLQELLDQVGLRVRCPTCGAAATLRCLASGNSSTGVFLYDHTVSGKRTFHGGPGAVPPLSLLAKPARRRRSR